MKSFELDLAGTGLRQDVARGDRRASRSQNRCQADQTKKKRPRQQGRKANVAPLLFEGENCALKGLHLQPAVLRVLRRHDEGRDRDEIRILFNNSMEADHGPIELVHFSYGATADEC
jgi:hypothetical protein